MFDTRNAPVASRYTPAPMWLGVIDPVVEPSALRVPPAAALSAADGERCHEKALQAMPEKIMASAVASPAGLRSGVRKYPLVFMAGALAVGALIARTRR